MRIAGRRPKVALADAVRWGDRTIPFGLRSAAGVLLILGGLLSFLPVLGLWMAPLGAAMIALDIPTLRRRLLAWTERVEAEEKG
ncbi:MAG TPA: hypothetical protein VIR38_03445 [Thalassobaculum sp.]